MAGPAFLITIDTEGDNLWAYPRHVTTENARFLPRFQALCEKHGLKPTYLTNYEMATDGQYQEFARGVLRRGTGEVGMHLHAWNSPPMKPLTDDDFSCNPYLIEYPEPVMREKVQTMTGLLESTFQTKMLSHRAGRWAFNATYLGMLVEHGYRVDCSVTPHVSWRSHGGDPKGSGGTDYTHFPAREYFPDPHDISKPAGRSEAAGLLELPMTIVPTDRPFAKPLHRVAARGPALLKRVVNRLLPPLAWLRPNGRNLDDMLWVLDQAIAEKRGYVEFMLHSSELMPGGSPTFTNEAAIDRLYAHLERLFRAARDRFTGMTLQEYDRHYRGRA